MKVNRVEQKTTVNVSESDAIAKSLRHFGSRLYGALDRSESGSFICSPYSVSSAVALAHIGAAGSTKKQIDDVLGYDGLDPVRAALALKWLERAATSRTDKLHAANAAWLQSGYAFLDSFRRDLRAAASELRELDFKNNPEGCQQKINDWVEEHTQGKIKNLIPKLDGLITIILTNAVHFLGQWEKPFDEARTVPDQFRGLSGPSDVQMMYGMNLEGRYTLDDEYEALEIPYSGRAGMLLILPRDAEDPSRAFADVSARMRKGALLDDVFGGQRTAKATLELPKFRLDSSFSLNGALETLGLGDMFREGVADFSGMTGDRELYVSQVVHKAMVAVNEKETEAAAATGMMLKRSCSPLNELRVTLRFDRPFLFAIVAHRAPLFVGRVVDL